VIPEDGGCTLYRIGSWIDHEGKSWIALALSPPRQGAHRRIRRLRRRRASTQHPPTRPDPQPL